MPSDMDLQTMSRRELQDLAKIYGIRGNQKTIELITQLEPLVEREADENDDANQMVAQVNKMSLADDKLANSPVGGGGNRRVSDSTYETPSSKPGRRKSGAGLSGLRTPSTRIPTSGSSNSSSSSRRATIGPAELWSREPYKSKEEHTPLRKRRDSLETMGSSQTEVMTDRVNVAVNAIKALRAGEKGCTFDQICEFIKLNPTKCYDSGRTAVQLHRTLRLAVDKGAAQGLVGESGEIRFALPRESSEGRGAENASPPRTLRGGRASLGGRSSFGGRASLGSLRNDFDATESFVVEKPKTKESNTRKAARQPTLPKGQSWAKIRAAACAERKRRMTFRKSVVDQAGVDAVMIAAARCKGSAETMLAMLAVPPSCPGCKCNKTQPSHTVDYDSDGPPPLYDPSPAAPTLPVLSTPVPAQRTAVVCETPAAPLPAWYGPSARSKGQKSAPDSHAEKPSQAPEQQPNLPSAGHALPVPSPGGDWVIKQSRSKPGKFYYYNKVTKETTWSPPDLSQQQ